MSTTYNGTPGNINANPPTAIVLATVSETIPADGDTRSASTVNTALQKLLDYIAYILQGTAYPSLTFVGNPGNAASTNYWAWAGTSQAAVAANGTASAIGQTMHMAGFNGYLRGFVVKTGTTTVGGTVTLTLMINGVAQAATIALGAGAAAGSIQGSATARIAVNAGDVIEIRIGNGVGVTTSIGVSMLSVVMSLE